MLLPGIKGADLGAIRVIAKERNRYRFLSELLIRPLLIGFGGSSLIPNAKLTFESSSVPPLTVGADLAAS